MPCVPRIPDPDTFARRWSAMAVRDRRRVVRAVNRGLLLQDRKEAALAVVLARRQQRFWRIAAIAAPVVSIVVGVLISPGAGLAALIGNAVFGAVVLAGMGLFFFRRAQRAEALNEQFAVHGRRPSV